MSQCAVEFHPLAADEAKAGERWYRERNEIASVRFQRELDRAVDLIPNDRTLVLLTSVILGEYYYDAFRSSSCIVYDPTMFRSSLSRMRGGGPHTGERVDRRFRWLEK